MEKLLEVKNLKTYFFLDEGVVKAVDGVDFPIFKGKCLGIVGESGCGKSVTARSIMQLVPSPPGKIIDGEILFYKDDTTTDITRLKKNGRQMRNIRGAEISMIFQEPMSSLSPVHTVGNQIIEAILLHQKVNKKEARGIAIEMLKRVRIPRPDKVVDDYPSFLSGGMRQRAMIALALCCHPSLLIADEPTTALDVTVQAQILALMKGLQEETHMSMLMITHNMRVVAQVSDFVAVAYLGRIVEYGEVIEIFQHPLHPYTKALFDSIPTLEGDQQLSPIEGSVPDPYAQVLGCPFRDRCQERIARCDEPDVPPLLDVGDGHQVRCFHYTQAIEGDSQ